MTLNNDTKENAEYMITSANGRETSVGVRASSHRNVDLSKYQSPFSAQATVGSSTTEMLYGLDESESVSLSYNGESYVLSATGDE